MSLSSSRSVFFEPTIHRREVDHRVSGQRWGAGRRIGVGDDGAGGQAFADANVETRHRSDAVVDREVVLGDVVDRDEQVLADVLERELVGGEASRAVQQLGPAGVEDGLIPKHRPHAPRHLARSAGVGPVAAPAKWQRPLRLPISEEAR